MILGLGTDIIEIDRIADSIQKHGDHFLRKIFTAKEREYCLKHSNPAPQFSGRFAAKEAVVKALGRGFHTEYSWLDIEILNDANGKPVVYLSTAINQKFQNPHILVSISHCRAYATATAIYIEK